MVAWFLNRALTRFRHEVNTRWPNRDKRSDGTIGDAAHQASTSDHNQDADGSVDAWDMDNNLTPNKAESDRIIYSVLIPAFQRHEAAQYWIYQKKIASRSDGWKVKPYNGPSDHEEHVHWNTRTAFENSTKPWLPEEEDVPLTEADVAAVTNGVAKMLNVRYGFPVDAKPSAYATLAATPTTTVKLSDEDRKAIAAQVIDALKSGAFKFEEGSNV